MRKLDYEVLSDAELEQVLERSVAKYDAGPDTRRANQRAQFLARLLPTRRFFRTRSEVDGASASDGLLAAAVLATVVAGILLATLDLSLLVGASIWLATLAGVAGMKYRLRAGVAAQRAAGVRQNL
jgi:hypothetical protein